MLESPVQSAPLSRAAGKQRSRQKLITATINSIAKVGFADTTLARVSAGAGLSRGIVNFHFRSKDALFLEALRAIAREYQENWARAFDNAGPTAAEKLEAVLMVDFDPPVSNRNRIAAWFAYIGEAKSRPTYIETCREKDQVAYETVIDLCRALIEEGGYTNLSPERTANAISAMGDGLWLYIHIEPHHFNAVLSKLLQRYNLFILFPKKFPSDAGAPLDSEDQVSAHP
jgi:TetR/AcrR family transcriptional repressor of bet genes